VYQIDNLVASSTAIDLNTELNTQLNLLNTASTTIMDMGMGTIRTIATAGKFARARAAIRTGTTGLLAVAGLAA